jgi:proteasome lid subunit RPN8/RPN11
MLRIIFGLEPPFVASALGQPVPRALDNEFAASEADGVQLCHQTWPESRDQRRASELTSAFGIRAAIKARLGANPPKSRRERLVATVLERLDTGAIDPEPANSALSKIAVSLSADLRCDPASERAQRAAADRLLGLPTPQLEAMLSTLARLPVRAPTRLDRSGSGHAANLHGQRIIGELGRRLRDSERLRQLLNRISFAPPFAFGLAFEGVEPARAVTAIEQMGDEEFGELAGDLDAHGACFLAIQEVIEPSRSRSRESICAQRARVACDFSNRFGVDRTEIELEMKNRQRLAERMFDRALDHARARWGEVGERVLGRLSRSAEITHIADLRNGIRVHTDLDSTVLMQAKVLRLTARIDRQMQAVLGKELVAAMRHDPVLAPLARMIRSQHVAATLFARHSTAEDRSVSGATLRLKAEYESDPQGYSSDLRAFAEISAETEAAVRATLLARALRRAEASARALTLDRPTRDRMVAHFCHTYPAEGIGYVVSDGLSDEVLFVANEVAQRAPKMASLMCLDDAADLERISVLIEKTGLMLLAKAHSHPDELPVPMTDDMHMMRRLAPLLPELCSIIVSTDGTPEHASIAAYNAEGQVRLDLR